MKIIAALAVALSTCVPLPVLAQSQPVVVELFTSQGCSSCPPADALLRRLAQRDDVIPLALHVDYWDYIGWKDEFANPDHTLRQKGYAAAAGRRMIYTPQMVINGQEDLVGAKPMELADLINAHKARPAAVNLLAQRQGQGVHIRLAPASGPLAGPLNLFLVQYVPNRMAHITRGENAGRDIDYANVVDDWQKIGTWDGLATIEVEATLKSDHPAVVLVQHAGPGKIVGAARAD
ncbi:DUF1223 domain-containing protein [Arenibacterium sp. CAU 1754]